MSLFQGQAGNGENVQKLGLANIGIRLLIGGVVFAAIKLVNVLVLTLFKLPTMNVDINNELTALAVVLNVIEGVVTAGILYVLAARLPYRPLVRFLAIFVPFFWIDFGSNTLELMFFSTYSAPAVIITWIDSIAESLLIVGAFVWLLPASENYRGAPGLKTILGQRPLWSWIWRSLVVTILYVPTYITFGSLIYPLVKPYYTNPAYGLNLTIPALGPFIVLELVRGLLYVVAILPVLAVTRGSRWQTLIYIFVLAGLFNGWQLFFNLTWPAQLRFSHAAEITGDVLVQSLLYCWLLTLKFKRHEQGDAIAG